MKLKGLAYSSLLLLFAASNQDSKARAIELKSESPNQVPPKQPEVKPKQASLTLNQSNTKSNNTNKRHHGNYGGGIGEFIEDQASARTTWDQAVPHADILSHPVEPFQVDPDKTIADSEKDFDSLFGPPRPGKVDPRDPRQSQDQNRDQKQQGQDPKTKKLTPKSQTKKEYLPGQGPAAGAGGAAGGAAGENKPVDEKNMSAEDKQLQLKPPSKEMKDVIDTETENLATFLRDRNHEKVSKQFVEDAVVNYDKAYTGSKQIQAFAQTLLHEGNRYIKITQQKLNPLVSGTDAMESGTYKMGSQLDAGTYEHYGFYTAFWTKVDDGWKIKKYMMMPVK